MLLARKWTRMECKEGKPLEEQGSGGKTEGKGSHHAGGTNERVEHTAHGLDAGGDAF